MKNISLIYQKIICPTPVITNRRSVVSTCYFLSRNQILTLLAAAATESVNFTPCYNFSDQQTNVN